MIYWGVKTFDPFDEVDRPQEAVGQLGFSFPSNSFPRRLREECFNVAEFWSSGATYIKYKGCMELRIEMESR